MVRVIISGAKGRMGTEVVKAVTQDDELEIVALVDPSYADCSDSMHFATLNEALSSSRADVMVDFTRPDTVEKNVESALIAGVNCVVGTTGMNTETLEKLAQNSMGDACLFVAPNFAIGAVMMMLASRLIAKYMGAVEIIELHHDKKLDAPSGTALRTAELIASARTSEPKTPGAETEIPGMEGARGAEYEGIHIHSVRLPGFVAHQEVIFGSLGQTLTLRHDSIDRTSFMPGVVLACKKVPALTGLVVGLENLLED